MEIQLTRAAKEELTKILTGTSSRNMPRLFIAGYGWSGPSLDMTLDEPQKTDVQLEAEGIAFLVEGITAERFDKLTIDYTNNWIRRGFSINPYGVTFSE